MMQRTTVLLLLTLMPLAAGCAAGTTGMQPSATMTTAILGWERYLKIDVAPPAQPGGRNIEGYISSLYGTTLVNVQLLAQGLDASGNVVSQRVEWLRTPVAPLQRVYFQIPGLPAAAQYRVSVWAFDSLETDSWM